MRPLLLLDFDGPLNPHRANGIPLGYQQHEIVEGEKTWCVLLNPQHGVELNALASIFDLVWASSWEHGANRLLGPLLGLPELPTIIWPDRAPVRRGSWKTPYIAEYVGDRSFVWVDDEAEETEFTGDHQLVYPVDARVGLTTTDFVAIRSWVDGKSFADKAFPAHP
jgi:hypothetical protein